MIGFFVAATVLLLTVLGATVYPLMRERKDLAEDQRGDVIALNRERLEELKRRKAAGEIDDADFDEQVRDLEAQLADDLHSRDSADVARPGGDARWIGVAVMVFIPVLSGLLYLSLGTPRSLLPGADAGGAVAGESASISGEHPGDVNAMVTRLAERLKNNPDDAEGWFMLGRSYLALKRYGDAVEAFRRLHDLVGDAPDVLVAEATALALHQGGDLSGEPMRLVRKALDQQPDHAQALWMAATAAYQTQDYKTALDYYQRVRPLVQGESRQQVDNMLQALADKGYGQFDAEQSTAQSSTPASAPPAGSSPVALRVNVSLSPALQADMKDSDTLFIFAKAVNGPPMPLAVVRKRAADLPLTVTLDDSQAMTPQLKLSSFQQVTIGARVSSSGQPIAQPGDLEGETSPVSTDAPGTVEVTIDRVVSGGNS